MTGPGPTEEEVRNALDQEFQDAGPADASLVPTVVFRPVHEADFRGADRENYISLGGSERGSRSVERVILREPSVDARRVSQTRRRWRPSVGFDAT